MRTIITHRFAEYQPVYFVNSASKITGLDDLPDTNIKDFGAVLVICKLSGGSVEYRANDFLEVNSENPKLILLLTTALKGPVPEQACFVMPVMIVIAIVAYVILPYTPGISSMADIFNQLQLNRFGGLVALVPPG
ncbi:MAG: hypothetical protein ACLFST_09785 [Spirochaetia bacterium]